MKRKKNVLSGILLIASTSIGAGMIALPSMTGSAGILPAILMTTVAWLMMTATALLFLEAILWMPKGASFLSISERFLGKWGRKVTGFLFIFLYTALLVAYISGAAPLLASLIGVNPLSGYLLFTLFFGLVVAFGSGVVNRVNRILVLGMAITFFSLIFFGSQEVQLQFFERRSWTFGFLALPILFSAFGFHNVIPTVVSFLERDIKTLRFVIICGATLPYITYLLWQMVIIGMVPEDKLLYSQATGTPITELLTSFTGNPSLGIVATFFGFFAMVTSFLGVALSMVDFYADGFQTKKRGALSLLVLLPPLGFAISTPGLFVTALGYAGGFGEVLLNALLPIAVVWVGRYRLGLNTSSKSLSGKPFLILLTLLSIGIIALEMFTLV